LAKVNTREYARVTVRRVHSRSWKNVSQAINLSRRSYDCGTSSSGLHCEKLTVLLATANV